MLRELGQNVRNNITVFLINIFIAVMVLCCVMPIIFSDNTGGNAGSGRILFSIISSVTCLACLLIVVISSFVQTGKQRKENDLMFASAMSPWSLITGKWLSGAVMTLILLSLSAPFIAVAYLLRGIDIQDILTALINTFVSIQLLNAAGISFASMAKTQGMSSLAVFIGAFAVIYSGMGVMFLPLMFSASGHSALMPVWIVEALYITALLSLTLLFLFIGSAGLSPLTSNRLLPVRIMVTVEFLLSLGLIYFLSSSPYAPLFNPATIWFVLWTTLTVLILLLTVHEREQWCFRIRRTIPKNFIIRLLCFPFYTGSPCGIIWTILLFAAAFAVFFVSTAPSPSAIDVFLPALFIVVFAFDYCITAMLIQSKLDPHRQFPVCGTVLALLLFFTLGSFILSFFFFASSAEFLDNEFYIAYRDSVLAALNPFMLFDNSGGNLFIPIAGAAIWFLLLLPCFAVWFVRRVRHFTLLGSDDTMTLEQAIEAVQQAEANVR
ncbi:hypothetical protein FACS18942_08520 [Planctomycetales bacterium]|nr:hypothetical protein FACS18942_08520 [Planctomycetales bacterium]